MTALVVTQALRESCHMHSLVVALLECMAGAWLNDAVGRMVAKGSGTCARA